ncbi:hypothetical protein CGRA01v4_05983 [Colletotrichum graminicola]|uniref:Paired amphipathic helix protein sin3a n=1 Tax=Colletotrichum graminicola (strain M1.001 / M2 / FGSC 10212) TaxID=645133 RepID=E3QYI4_COLGM|nr:uncharacterized protein GLRG_11030 [Colletotrichum graminicola M1.001]EFQ35922.1 hypothetical protein GLRG_11030 [Colletotrichum graminicola M1.001]WDK14702.1 hypothetical protein CGRA01v4_05983 [Colletotrichum graminicola]
MALTKLSQLALLLSGFVTVRGQQNALFNQVININGDMQPNTLLFPDGTKIETFSQSQHQIIVNQNPNPLSASHVVGSTGQPFVQLSRNSLSIQTNGAIDLVGAQIELPIDQAMLSQAGVTADNTFVAKLSKDRQAWIIMEGLKSVNITDANVRMVKLNQIDGEFVAVGRQTSELGASLTPFGQPVSIIGSGIQEAEFQDGFRMSIKASQPMSIRTDVVNGISPEMVTNGVMSINNYRYLVTSNLAGVVPSLNSMTAVVQIPLNVERLMAMALRAGAQPQSSITLGIAQRPVLQNPGGATSRLQSPRFKRQAGNNTVGSQPSANGPGNTSGNGAGTAIGNSPAVAPPPAGGNTQPPATGSGNTTGNGAGIATGNDPAVAPSPAGGNTQPPSNVSGNTTGNGAGTAVGNDPAVAQPPAGGNTQPPSTSPQTGQNPPSNASPPIPAASQLLLAQTFTPINAQILLDRENSRIAVPINQIDGEFILTMTVAGTPVGAQPKPVPQQGQPQPGQPQPAPQQGQPQPVQPQPAPQQGQPQLGQPQQGQPQQGQPQQGGGLVEPAPPQSGGIIAAQPSPARAKTSGNQPRQEAAAPIPAGAFEMKLADLMTMVEARRNGGMAPTWDLMSKLASQNKPVQKGSETPRRNSLLMRRRLGAHF